MADVTNGPGDAAAKTRALGRVLSPLEIKELTSLLPGEKAIRHDEFLGNSPEERFTEMGKLIEERLKDVAVAVEKHSSEGAAKWTPWIHRMNPQQMIAELRRREHLNERVIAHLTKELGVHLAMSVKIRNLIRQSQATMIDEAMDVPKGLQEFIIRLHAAGLKTASVKDLSKGSLESLVALLHGEVDADVMESIGFGKSGRFVSDDDAQRALDEADRLLSDHRDMMVEAVHADVPTIIEPVVPTGFDDEWNYENGPLPPEYWSTVQELPIPYVWEYRMAVGSEEESVLGMALPEAHSWAALARWDRLFGEIAYNPIRNKRAASNNVRDLMSTKMEIEPDDVDSNLVRTWLLLLAARLMTEEECDKLFEPGFFEGTVMPCPATGAGVVRQLVRKGE